MSVKKSSRGRTEISTRRSPLKEKRKKAAQAVMYTLLVVSAVAVGLLVYGLWQPAVRVQTIETEGVEGSEELELLARQHIQGTYFFVLPKDSIFFFPERTIEQAILAARPDIASVSVRRSNFDALSVGVVPRVAAYVWCGEVRIDGNETDCFETDWTGLIFKKISLATSSPTMLVRTYAPLTAQASSSDPYPIRSTLTPGASIPQVFEYIKEIKSLGTNIVGIRFHADEISLYTASGTYITYIAGREKEALALLTAALPSLSLADGSVEYLDLRFDSKVYVKRKGEMVQR